MKRQAVNEGLNLTQPMPIAFRFMVFCLPLATRPVEKKRKFKTGFKIN
jgi:hypothetical protein